MKLTINRKYRIILILIDFLWLVTFISTDSFLSIYILCSFIALFSILNLKGNDLILCRRNQLLNGVYAILWSGAVIAANYLLFLPFNILNIVSLLIATIGGFTNAYVTLLFTELTIDRYRNSQHVSKENNCKNKRNTAFAFLFPFVFSCLVNLSYLFFSAYPGNLSPDSISQIRQIITNEYSNHHPFWHTMLIKIFIDVGTYLFHDINAAVALYSVFQVLLMAFIFAFMIMTLYEARIPNKVLAVISLFVVFSPYHIIYSVTMWKDIVFGGAVAAFLTFLFRIINDIGNKNCNFFGMFIFGLGFCLWRSNGFFAFSVTFIIFSFTLFRNHNKVIICMATVMFFSYILKYPVIQALNVKQPDIAEFFSIPEQQIARVIVENGNLTKTEVTLLSRVVDIERVKAEYRPWISDPIKEIMREKGLEYLSLHKTDYLKLWINVGIRNPKMYISAWIDQTKGYWNGGYRYWIWFQSIFDNEFGITRISHQGSINSLFTSLFDMYYISSYSEIFKSIGFTVWLTAMVLVIGIIRRNKNCILAIPGLVIILSLLISTPVYSEFRYAYAIFTGFPIVILPAVFLKQTE